MKIFNLYSYLIKSKPLFVILFVIITMIAISFKITDLKIDNSSDSLMLQSDSSLIYYQKTLKNYKEENNLVIAYTPNLDMLSEKNILIMSGLSKDLLLLDNVKKITSIINIPLMKSSNIPLSEMLNDIPLLTDKRIDKKKAKIELLTNPLYSNNIISKDFKTTAILITINDIKDGDTQTKLIKDIRNITDKYKSSGNLVLGGVSMIASDMGTYIKKDLKTYGISIFILLLLILLFLYREVYFVVNTFLILSMSLLVGAGVIALFNWPITVISSNYMAMQLIITTSILIHLTVRYKLNENLKIYNYEDNIMITMREMFVPTALSILTTVVGFVSLLYADILPIVNLGLMMGTAIIISLIISYLMFPALLMVFKRKKRNNYFLQLLSSVDKIIFTKSYIVLIITAIIFIFSLYFGSKIFVENSFINYFKSSTEIYKGMYLIDNKLGGTTPLDIIIDLKENTVEIEDDIISENDGSFDEFDEFEEEQGEGTIYWFTNERLALIKKVHEYLENTKSIGKVLSANSIIELGKQLNDDKYLTTFELSLVLNKMPEEYKEMLIYPYINIDKNQLRFVTRVIDSDSTLRRNELVTKINKDLTLLINDKEIKSNTTNIMVLYNNMLQSLFSSQIKTLSLVLFIIFGMFLLLFRSFKYALIGITVNIIPIGAVFMLLGYLRIPLDMMTITIASISMGIAVDNTVHYLFKYKKEIKSNDVETSIINTNKSIGQAILYTTISIILGFMTMLFSEFIPTINFAILISVAIFIAFLSNLFLLPVLLKKIDSKVL